MTKPRGRLGAIRKLLSLMLAVNVLTLITAALVLVESSTVTDFPVTPELIYGRQTAALLWRADQRLNPLKITVNVRDPSPWQTVLGLFSHGVAAATASVAMIIMARRLVDLAIRTHPFTPAMVGALRRLGLVVLVGGFVAELVRSTAALLLYTSAVPHGWPSIDVHWTISFWWLLLGLVILASAQVVEHGCALRTELDQVI